ncbi:MAG TPA: ABC transporter permease [Rhodospirillales bacterium]|jgi:peptide/nickel transport system permease protein|nr:ABC transporter permease [Rhodospirillales bacterium]HJO86772.1 ABC transporter permease [Rhodospirillales bacterium]|tara:strand:- start:1289 stop:2257 length:969 start_codon:yes stop_codon:yes gene_type:complete
MISKIIGRLTQTVFVLVATSFISFAIFSFSPDPADSILGENATIEDRENLRKELGYDRPFVVQFLDFIGRFGQGDFGKSLRTNERVSDLLIDRAPATLELVLVSTVVTMIVGILLGIYTGTHRHSRISQFILSFSLLGVSVPTFLLGLLAVFLFAVHLDWLPASSRAGVVDLGFWSTGLLTLEGWRSLLLPSLVHSVFNIGLFIRLVRADVLEIRTSDYITFARARGLSEKVINYSHVLPNSLTPIINIGALNIGGLIAFSLITETVFQWPGLGLMFVQAIQFSDFPIMSVYFVLIAFTFVFLNLLADILVGVVDPRIRRSG